MDVIFSFFFFCVLISYDFSLFNLVTGTSIEQINASVMAISGGKWDLRFYVLISFLFYLDSCN